MKKLIKINFLFGAIFFSIPLLADTPTHQIFLCNQGKKPDCSDCDDVPRGYAKLLVNEKENSIMVQDFDLKKVFYNSHLLERCTIFDKNNWVCNYGNVQQYYKYKSHQGKLEFLFKDFKEYSNVVRMCGIPIN